jgi:hypothetical protein
MLNILLVALSTATAIILLKFVWYLWQAEVFLGRLSKWRGRMYLHTGHGIRANGPDCFEGDTDPKVWDTFCPITAIYYDKTGIMVPPSEATYVAKHVGISSDLAEHIMHAADSGWDKSLLRKRMLKTLGLKERSS